MATKIEQKFSEFDETMARRALDVANLNALRIALYQATADEELAAMDVVEVPFWSGAYQIASLDPRHAEVVKAKALDYLRSGAPSKCAEPSAEDLRHLMKIYTGEEVNDYLFHFGKEELNFEEFPRGANWHGDVPPSVKSGFHVIVIGAGAAGLVTAIQLDRLGIPFTIIERNPEVGGTWWTNDYPDARVDVPSHHYQLTVTKNYRWKHWFATQPELLEYIRHVTDTYKLRDRIRFNTELTEATWDDVGKKWKVALRNKNGQEEILEGNAIISGAGLFNAPNLPNIEGIDSFEGWIFHTTAWDHGFDYSGKRVGIIGVGCTGAQLMPRVAKEAGSVTIFQRSPQWVSKLQGYRDPISSEAQWLLDNVPHYWNWNSFGVFHTFCASDGALHALDDDWRSRGGQISEANDCLKRSLEDYIQSQFPGDPEMAAKLTPPWPPYARRLIVDNGWFDALKQPNVALVTDGIERITPRGVVTRDGTEHELDLLVIAGGFKTERYLWPAQYTGKDGLTLEEAWARDGARAYLGMTVPGFPNMFIVYGPNMQQRAGGLFSWIEMWARYSVQALADMLESGHRSIECRQDVFESYNLELDSQQGQCIWALESSKSYFFNGDGRQIVNNPRPPSVNYLATRRPDMADFILD